MREAKKRERLQEERRQREEYEKGLELQRWQEKQEKKHRDKFRAELEHRKQERIK